MYIFSVILFHISVFLFVDAYNPLLDPDICGSPNDLTGFKKFSYGPTTDQKYKYIVDVKTFFNGTSKNESTIHIDALATLSFISQSDGILSLSDVTLTEDSLTESVSSTVQATSDAFSEKVSQSDLRFAFKDGVITELCPQPEEVVWVLNFKRGILSMLHNTMKRFDLDHTEIEDDVKGTCTTNYKVIGANNTSLLVEKTKDLGSCSDRVKLYSVIQSSKIFDFQSASQQEVVWKSSSKCNLSIDHNIYSQITCREDYLLQPLSNEQAGAATIVEQKLILQEEKPVVRIQEKREVRKRSLLGFDYTPSDKSTQSDIKVARGLVKQLCKQNGDSIKMDISELISKSIQSLRMLSHAALTAFYRHASMMCPTGKENFLDLVPYVSTGASVALMKDIILTGNITEETLEDWMVSIAFIPQPEDTMIEAVSDILAFTNFTSNTALSVASIVHTYCKNNLSCIKNEFVEKIIIRYQDFIKNNIELEGSDNKNHESIMVVFKSLATVGVVLERFQDELHKIILNRSFSIDIRIAAIEAFRRLPCEEDKPFFIDVFRDDTEDVEVRIAAYLQLMRCPNYLLIRTIEHCLKKEEVNQVGSFVWTHLKNLIKSSNPGRVEIQSLLSEEDLIKKFSSDFRKFSHNREGAVYFDDYNVGGSYDNNIIFSTSSYIPRTAMANFTLDLFGQSINILEVYGRAEGLEHYLESLFGMNGKYKDYKVANFFKTRTERDTSSANEIQAEVDKLPKLLKFTEEPKIALGMKIFGNDIKYNSWNGYNDIKNTLDKFNPLTHIKMLLSGQKLHYNKTAMILDSKLVVPTGAGLPLSLNLLGSSSINIKFYGSLQAKDISKKGKLEMVANVEPMVSVDLTAEMGVDAYYLSSAIKLNARIGTETAVQSEIKIHGTKLVSVKLSLPKETNKIFEARTKLLVKQKNLDMPQSGLQENRNEYSICTWPVVEKTIGLMQCAEYSFVNASKTADAPKFLLAGPAGIHWNLNKTDPTARTYVFEYKWSQHQDTSLISLTFDTPGSKIKRLLHANVTIDQYSRNFTMLLESAAGTVLAKGKYMDTDEVKSLRIALDINNKKHFDTSLVLQRQERINGYTYLPKAYLEINGDRVLDLSGKVDYISKKDVSQYTVDLKFHTKRLDSKLFGYISQTQTSIGTDLHIDYKFVNTDQQRTSIKFTIGNKSKKNKVHIVAACSMASTAYPHYSFHSNLTFQQIGSHMEFQTYLNQDGTSQLDSEKDKALSLAFILSSKGSLDGGQIIRITAGVKRKSSNLDLQTEFEYRTTISDVDCKFIVKYGDNKQVSVTALWSHPRTTLLQVEAKLNITAPSFTPMVLDLQIREKPSTDRDYNCNLKATWFSGVSLQAVGVYQDKSTAMWSNHHIKTFIKSPNFQDISLDIQFYRDNGLIRFILEGDYADQDYAFSLVHDYKEANEVKSDVQVKYMSKVYSLKSLVYNGDYIKASAELHIDQMRDVDLSLLIHNHDDHKSFSVDLNWDANRDPNQKLLIAANYTKFADFNCKSDLIISYPGRTILGKYEIKIVGGRIDTLISLSWDDGKTLGVILNVLYDFENKFFLDIYSRLNTPIDNWKIINVFSRIEHENDMYRVHGEFSRDSKKRVAVDLFGNFLRNGSGFECTYIGSIFSSIDHIPNINASISHSQNNSHFDTKLYLMRNPEFVIDIDSHWNVEKSINSTTLSGTVHCYSPFKGLNKGFLISKIDFTADKYLKGVATLDMNHKKMLFNIEGKLKKLMDSLLVLNATTIDENYQFLFTLSREERRFALIISNPYGNVGTEVILQANSITNFNIKFYLATPIEFLQKVLVIAKLKPKEADFRIGWNKMLFGATGMWRYSSMIDFEYSYKIFTPLEDFKETGLTAKLVFATGIDLQMSLKAYRYKLGIQFLGKPNSRTLKELGADINKIYGIGTTKNLHTEGWEGSVEIDTVIYPTIKGNLEIYQEGILYILLSKLYLPDDGVVTISNEFEYIDVLHMKNGLTITTPYIAFKTIDSNFQLEVETNTKYLFALSLDREIYDDTTIKSGIYGLYNVNRRKTLANTYNVTVSIVTPFEKFKKFDLSSILETEEKFSYVEVHATKDDSSGSIEVTSELDNDVSEISSSFEVHTPSIEIPEGHAKIRKLFSSSDNFLEVNIEIPKILKSQIFGKYSWLIKSLYEFKALAEINTPFTGMDHAIAGVNVDLATVNSSVSTVVKVYPLSIELNSTYANDLLDLQADLIFNEKRFPVILKCKTIRSSTDRVFDGDLNIRGQPYKINGKAKVIAQIPSTVYIKITPQNKTEFISFEYDLKKDLTGYELIGAFQRYGVMTNFKGHGILKDKLNWEGNLDIIPGQNVSDKMSLHAIMASEGNEINVDVSAKTNIPNLENPVCTVNYVKDGITTNVFAKYKLVQASGNANVSYIWKFLDNMYISLDGFFRNLEYDSHSRVIIFYKNPDKKFKLLSAGADIEIDKLLSAMANATATLHKKNDLGLEGHFKWPNYSKNVQSFFAKLNYGERIEFIDYLLKYANSSSKIYGSWGKILLPDANNFDGNVDVTWNDNHFENVLNVKRLQQSLDAWYNIKATKQGQYYEVFTDVFYREVNDHVNLTYRAFYPKTKPLVYATVDYVRFDNMNGRVNLTIPHRYLNSSTLHFTTRTTETEYYRFGKLNWGNETMFIEAKANNTQENTDKNSKGEITVEVPLTTKHKAFVEYEYHKSALATDGLCKVQYNGNQVAEGKFSSVSENSTEFSTKTMEAELQNSFAPVGARYVYKYSLPSEKLSAPYLDVKYVHLFNLKNRSVFNVSGELKSVTNTNGQEYQLQATHSNRTILMNSRYVSEAQKYKQFSRLELSPTVWLECNLKFYNRTTDEAHDVQDVVVDLFYPRRNFTGQLSYNLSEEIIYGEASLVWDVDRKSAQAALDWRRLSSQSDLIAFNIKHPSFSRDVSFSNEYGYDDKSIYSKLLVDYSLDREQRFSLSARVEDMSNTKTYNYTYNIFAQHNHTTLLLNTRGSFYCSPNKCGTVHITDYRRSIVPLTRTEYIARINNNNNELELKKNNSDRISYFFGTYAINFPVYTARMYALNGTQDNVCEGNFIADLKSKVLSVDVNTTLDNRGLYQTYGVYGIIPDARSATFDMWRNYDDKNISDVHFYLRLNHSRFITSQLFWRPELMNEFQRSLLEKVIKLHHDLLENINNTKQYIRAETISAISDTWENAKPSVQTFLDDLKNLSVIADDVAEFKQFLNESYYTNEFYIKDIYETITILFDELSLKTHLQKLPKIFHELWEIMGESGEKIKKNIIWITEQIKEAYKNSTDFLHQLVNGDPVEQLSKLFEKAIERYDDFIKNIHVALLRYMEHLWNQTYDLIVENWHQTLAALEPSFLKFVHYLETIAWSTGKDFLDFLYIRKNKIMESAYFMEFAKLSKDIDKFYREITGDDTLEAIAKYSQVAWNFLHEKYLRHIPFGKELQDVFMEIVDELKELGNIPSVKAILDTFTELLSYVKYYYQKLQVQRNVEHLVRMVYSKIYNSETALEIENRKRIPKTKFMFEPDDGYLLLEQKLPMSWHAFNETPNIQEIPEIKVFYDVYTYLASAKLSFWDYYYDYKPYLDTDQWFPPFSTHAMMVGSKFFVTFDKSYYDFKADCTYLMATDSVDRNFTILISADKETTDKKLLMLIKNNLVTINLNKDVVQVNNMERLPVQVGDTYIFKEHGILKVKSDLGFTLECNTKFQICTFEMSGWYFGKTAGLWGTYNNEASDDFTLEGKTNNISEFSNTWALDKTCVGEQIIESEKNTTETLNTMCEEFFTNKISQLSTCFSRIPVDNFLKLCLGSKTEKEACSSAIAYIDLCDRINIPLRVPDVCVSCKLLNGTEIQEGRVIHQATGDAPKTADIVFIMEAKICNKDVLKVRNMGAVIEAIEEELQGSNVINNRYSLVTFGGNGVYSLPRSIIVKGQVFTDSKSFLNHFSDIPPGIGSGDIYDAIIFATQLSFRAGVSKNFVLIPCSECQGDNMVHDYSTIHEVLVESSVSLHVLMNDIFTVPANRNKENKVPFGLDLSKAYTKKDSRNLVGDSELRNSISLPKSTLGFCFSLALETKGSVFSARFLESQKMARKFSIVFAKRIALSANQTECIDCECTATNSGVPYMDCYPCTYHRASSDMENEENFLIR